MKFHFDVQLGLATGIILLLGALIQYSIGPSTIDNHLLFVSIGLILALLVSRLDFTFVRSFSNHIFFGTIVLLILTLLLATATRGSRRWLDLGLFQFQPSEIAKFAMILVLPEWLSRYRIDTLPRLLRLGFIVSLPFLLIFLQPDLGTALIMLFICASMFFAAGLRWQHIGLGIAILLILSPILWLTLQDYQKDRLLTFANPTADPLGKGYNSIQSLIAVGSGQFFGRGLGHGTQSKLKFLPEYQTDFVFASLAEELGLIGSLLLIIAFGWLIGRLLYLSAETDNQYASYALVGIASMLVAQTVINIGMNIGILPVTGITLPLVSAGGTSIIISLVSIGLANGLIQERRLKPGIEINGKDE